MDVEPREQHHADGHHRGAGDRERLVAPEPLIRRPLTIEVTSSPAIIGVSCRPDDVGLRPFTICRKSGRYVTEPKSAKPMMKPIARADGEDAVAEELERQDRLGRALLANRKHTSRTTPSDDQHDDLAASPTRTSCRRGS